MSQTVAVSQTTVKSECHQPHRPSSTYQLQYSRPRSSVELRAPTVIDTVQPVHSRAKPDPMDVETEIRYYQILSERYASDNTLSSDTLNSLEFYNIKDEQQPDKEQKFPRINKAILSLKALERVVDLKVKQLHQGLLEIHSGSDYVFKDSSVTSRLQTLESCDHEREGEFTLSGQGEVCQTNSYERLLHLHLDIAKLVEIIVMKYNNLAVTSFRDIRRRTSCCNATCVTTSIPAKDADVSSQKIFPVIAATHIEESASLNVSPSLLTQVEKSNEEEITLGDDVDIENSNNFAINMLDEAAKFLQPPCLQLLIYQEEFKKEFTKITQQMKEREATSKQAILGAIRNEAMCKKSNRRSEFSNITEEEQNEESVVRMINMECMEAESPEGIVEYLDNIGLLTDDDKDEADDNKEMSNNHHSLYRRLHKRDVRDALERCMEDPPTEFETSLMTIDTQMRSRAVYHTLIKAGEDSLFANLIPLSSCLASTRTVTLSESGNFTPAERSKANCETKKNRQEQQSLMLPTAVLPPPSSPGADAPANLRIKAAISILERMTLPEQYLLGTLPGDGTMVAKVLTKEDNSDCKSQAVVKGPKRCTRRRKVLSPALQTIPTTVTPPKSYYFMNTRERLINGLEAFFDYEAAHVNLFRKDEKEKSNVGCSEPPPLDCSQSESKVECPPNYWSPLISQQEITNPSCSFLPGIVSSSIASVCNKYFTVPIIPLMSHSSLQCSPSSFSVVKKEEKGENGATSEGLSSDKLNIYMELGKVIVCTLLKLRATTLNNYACVYRRQNRLRDAIHHLRTAIKIEEMAQRLMTISTTSVEKFKLLYSVPSPFVAVGPSPATVTNLAALYCQVGRYQEAVVTAKKAVVLMHKQECANLNTAQSSDVFTISDDGDGVFVVSQAVERQSRSCISAADSDKGSEEISMTLSKKLKDEAYKQNIDESGNTQNVIKNGKSEDMRVHHSSGLAAVVYLNMALALEPVNPTEALEAYATAVQRGSEELQGGKLSPVVLAIESNRDKYIKFLQCRKGLITEVKEVAVAATDNRLVGTGKNKNDMKGKDINVTGEESIASPAFKGLRNKMANSGSSRTSSCIPQNNKNTTIQQVSNTILTTIATAPDNHNTHRNRTGIPSENTLSIQPPIDSDSTTTEHKPLDKDEIISDLLAPFTQGPLFMPSLSKIREFQIRLEGHYRYKNNSALKQPHEPSDSHRQDTCNDGCEERPLPFASVLGTSTFSQSLLADGSISDSNLSLSMRASRIRLKLQQRDPTNGPYQGCKTGNDCNIEKLLTEWSNNEAESSDHFNEDAFTLLVETDTALRRAADNINAEDAGMLSLPVEKSTTVEPKKGDRKGGSRRYSPHPPSDQPSPTLKQLSKGRYLGGPEYETGFISSPTDFLKEARKGDDLVSFFTTRLNVMLKVENIFEMKYRRATSLQCFFRSILANKRTKRLRELRDINVQKQELKEQRAGNTITKFFQFITTRRAKADETHAKQQRESILYSWATVVMQKYIRRWVATKEFERRRKQYAIYIIAVKKVQCWMRQQLSKKCRKMCEESLKFETEKVYETERLLFAAMKIQALFRGHRSRITTLLRRGLVKEAVRMNRIFNRSWAAVTIQRFWNGFIVRKVTAPVLSDKNKVRRNKEYAKRRRDAVTRISSLWRGYHVRKSLGFKFISATRDSNGKGEHHPYCRNHYCHFCCTVAVIVLQKWMRRLLARKELIRRKMARREEGEKLKSLFFPLLHITVPAN